VLTENLFSSAELSPLGFAASSVKIRWLGGKTATAPWALNPRYGVQERPGQPPIQPLYLRFPAALTYNNKLRAFNPNTSHSPSLPQSRPNHIYRDRVILSCIIAFFKMSGASSWLQKMRKGELVELCESVGYKEYKTPAHLAFIQQIG